MERPNIWRMLIVLSVSGMIVIPLTYFLAVKGVELKTNDYQPVLIRELTDVEKWKLFLYQEINDYKTYRLLKRIMFCESGFRQWDRNGNLLVNQGNQGLFQVNKLAHKKTYEAMNLNMENPYDNIRFAIFLYKRDGVSPWLKWSGHCFLKKII